MPTMCFMIIFKLILKYAPREANFILERQAIVALLCSVKCMNSIVLCMKWLSREVRLSGTFGQATIRHYGTEICQWGASSHILYTKQEAHKPTQRTTHVHKTKGLPTL